MKISFKEEIIFKKNKLDYLSENESRNQGVDKIDPNLLNSIENCINDLIKYFNNEDGIMPLNYDIEFMINIINNDDNNHNAVKALTSMNFYQILYELFFIYQDNYEFVSNALLCIGKLLFMESIRSFYVSQGFFENALQLITHEDDDIAKQSLFLVSELIDDTLKNHVDFDILEFLKYSFINFSGLGYCYKEYLIKSVERIVQYITDEPVINFIIPNLIDFYKHNSIFIPNEELALEDNSKAVIKRKNLYEEIKKFTSNDIVFTLIIKSIFNILKNSEKFLYKAFRDLIFNMVMNLKYISSTTRGEDMLFYILKIVQFIIYKDQDIGMNLLMKVPLQKFYFFIQNSNFKIADVVIDLFSIIIKTESNDFYNFCLESNVTTLILNDLLDEGPFISKANTVKFISNFLSHYRPKDVIETLVNNDFITICSAFLDMDDENSIQYYINSISIITQYFISIGNQGYLNDITSSILDTEICNQIETLISDGNISIHLNNECQNILNFCKERREQQLTERI